MVSIMHFFDSHGYYGGDCVRGHYRTERSIRQHVLCNGICADPKHLVNWHRWTYTCLSQKIATYDWLLGRGVYFVLCTYVSSSRFFVCIPLECIYE